MAAGDRPLSDLRAPTYRALPEVSVTAGSAANPAPHGAAAGARATASLRRHLAFHAGFVTEAYPERRLLNRYRNQNQA
jgi:hypothetical protein